MSSTVPKPDVVSSIETKAVRASEPYLAAHQYDEALAILRRVPEEVLSHSCRRLIEAVAYRAWLFHEVVDASRVDTPLLSIIDQLKESTVDDKRTQSALKRLDTLRVRYDEPQRPGRKHLTFKELSGRGWTPRQLIGRPWKRVYAESVLRGPMIPAFDSAPLLPVDENVKTLLRTYGDRLTVAIGAALYALGEGVHEMDFLSKRGAGAVLNRLTSLGGTKAAWGIDLGRSAVKAVCLRPNSEGAGWFVEDVLWIARPDASESDERSIRQADCVKDESLEKALSELAERMGKARKLKSCVCLGDHMLRSSITLPGASKSKIANAIALEAERMVPSSQPEHVWRYILAEGEPSGHKGGAPSQEALLAFLGKSVLTHRLEQMQSVDIRATSCIPDFLANWTYVERCLRIGGSGAAETSESEDEADEKHNWLFCDMGYDRTQILVHHRRKTVVTETSIGSHSIVRALAKHWNVSVDETRRRLFTEADPQARFQIERDWRLLAEQWAKRVLHAVDTVRGSADSDAIYLAGGGLRLHGFVRSALGKHAPRTRRLLFGPNVSARQ